MLCKKPYRARGVSFGCGQCLPCRINRRRQWMWRQYFESLTHEENCFVTLTYSDDNLPAGGNLEPALLPLWIDRLRKAVAPRKIRYFLVGEYGGNTIRPHYHLSLFGVSGDTILLSYGKPRRVADLINETWGLGFTYVAEFNEKTAQYVSGYVVKKVTDLTDERLYGKVPEFARMSRRPGIGAKAMETIGQTLLHSEFGRKLLGNTGDVPKVLKIGTRSIPMSRYLLEKLRIAVGFTDDQIREVKSFATYEKSVQLSDLYAAALAASGNASEAIENVNSIRLEDIQQRIRQAETRAKLFNVKKGNL